MSLLGPFSVLLFLGSRLVVLRLAARAVVLAMRGARARAWRSLRGLAVFVVIYAVVLACVGLAMPRRIVEAGGRECFDDWCAGGLTAAPSEPDAAASCPESAQGLAWTVTLRVSNLGRGRRERASNAAAVLEDQTGQ